MLEFDLEKCVRTLLMSILISSPSLLFVVINTRLMPDQEKIPTALFSLLFQLTNHQLFSLFEISKMSNQ